MRLIVTVAAPVLAEAATRRNTRPVFVRIRRYANRAPRWPQAQTDFPRSCPFSARAAVPGRSDLNLRPTRLALLGTELAQLC